MCPSVRELWAPLQAGCVCKHTAVCPQVCTCVSGMQEQTVTARWEELEL